MKYKENSFTISLIAMSVVGIGGYFLYRYLVDRGYIKPISLTQLMPGTGIIPGTSYTYPSQQSELIVLLKKDPTQTMVDQLTYMIPNFNQTVHIQQLQKGKDIVYGRTVRVPINYVAGKTEQFVKDLMKVDFIQSARISGAPQQYVTAPTQQLFTGQS
jgi:hypothetical protein